MTDARPISFLSDYGLDDDFVGVCHGVMARIAPASRVLDVTHGIPRHDIRTGALLLRRSLPYLPAGVHLAVVDPDVGTKRRAIAVRTAEEDRILVGPDNGLLSLAAQRFGGVVEAADVTRSVHRLEPVSATFHGRDLFAPVAAALAAGAPLEEAGDPLDADEVQVLHMPLAEIDADGLNAHAIAFDRFGNVTLDVEHEELTFAGLRLGRKVLVNDREAVYAVTFADVPRGELLLYQDAYRTLALAVNRGSAREALGLELDATVRLVGA
ncbi:MAG: SAM-dependent chlorinase/fluorinase [Solirubrobacterales bacterium]|nr:SAM-dependent chlorinase/fluorinase [Solirubrobacterales bacterium]